MRRAVLPLGEVAAQASKATSLNEVTSLYRVGDNERRSLAYQCLDPQRLGPDAIRALAAGSSRSQRVPLLENPRLEGAELDALVTGSFRGIDDPHHIYAWVGELLTLRPDQKTRIRHTLWTLTQSGRMAGSTLHDLSLIHI